MQERTNMISWYISWKSNNYREKGNREKSKEILPKSSKED